VTNLLKFIHLLTAILWIGGSIVMQVLSARVKGSGDPARVAAFGADAEFVGTRLFAPASILLLLSGVGTVFAGDYGFEQPWIGIGLLGWLLVAGIGGGMIGPQSQRLKKILAQSGPGHPDVRRISQRIERLTRLELALFVLLVADMVYKPGV
jgi:uncharacterized membrane protein